MTYACRNEVSHWEHAEYYQDSSVSIVYGVRPYYQEGCTWCVSLTFRDKLKLECNIHSNPTIAIVIIILMNRSIMVQIVGLHDHWSVIATFHRITVMKSTYCQGIRHAHYIRGGKRMPGVLQSLLCVRVSIRTTQKTRNNGRESRATEQSRMQFSRQARSRGGDIGYIHIRWELVRTMSLSFHEGNMLKWLT